MLPDVPSQIFIEVNDWSGSKIDMLPLPGITCPTGNAEFPRSDKTFVTSNSETLSVIFATSLGDSSISSNGMFGLFIDDTASLIPFTQTNSLYILSRLLDSVKYDGFVKSVTKVLLPVSSSDPICHLYTGILKS